MWTLLATQDGGDENKKNPVICSFPSSKDRMKLEFTDYRIESSLECLVFVKFLCQKLEIEEM